MEVNDYVHDLARAKETFVKKTDQQRDAFERDLTSQQSMFDYKVDKQKKISKENLGKIEDEYKRNIDINIEGSRESLKDKQDSFRRKLSSQVEESEKERRYTTDRFSNKLRHINDSFDTSTRELKDTNKSKYDSMEGKYRKLLSSSKDSFTGEIRDMQDRSQRAISDSRDKEQGTMVNLLRRNNEDKLGIIRANAKNQAMSNKIHDEQLRSVTNTHDNELSNLKAISQGQIDEIRGRAHLKEGSQSETFNESYKDLKRANEKRGERLKTQYKQEVKKMGDAHERSQGLMKRDVSESLAREYATKERAVLSKGELVKKYEHKLNSYRDRMTNEHDKFQNDVDNMNESIKSSLSDRSRKHSAQIEEKNRENHIFAQDMLSRFRDERQEITDSFRTKLHLDSENHNLMMNSERDNAKRSLDRQSRRFSNTLDEMRNKNDEQLQGTREAYAKSEKEFIQEAKRVFNRDYLEQRESNAEKIVAIEERNAQRLTTEKKKLVDKESYYENKLDALGKKMENEMKKQLLVHGIQKEDSQRDNKQAMKDMQRENRKTFMELKRRFDKQMAKTKRENDKLVTKIITTKDDQIRDTNQTNHRNLKVLESDYARRFKNLAVSHEMAMESLVQNYEDKIDQMKVNYEIKIDKASSRPS